MDQLLGEPRFDFLSAEDQQFILAFDAQMQALGFGFGSLIGDGYCWGRYMVIYRRKGVKSDKVVARLYLRDDGVVLRFFFSDIDRHRTYIEGASAHIQAVFTGPAADCQHCHNQKDGKCRFRKTYTLFNRRIEKCNGLTFEYAHPRLEYLDDYMALFREFYAPRRAARARA